MNYSKLRGFRRTYGLIKDLASINSPEINRSLLDQTMYNAETLPPLGKEYWWNLFMGLHEEKPVQLMILIFRKHGKKMLFNEKEMKFSNIGTNEFQAVTSGWIFDGNEMHDLGDTNTNVLIQKNRIISDISGQEMVLRGNYPNYRLELGDTVDLTISGKYFLQNKKAHGVFLPPFGVGWVDVFSKAEGKILGTKFNGAAHLQKVVGVTVYGPFHWGRLLFQNGSVASFFCLKTGKESTRLFYRSFVFFDNESNEIIEFNNPKLKISKIVSEKTSWIIEAKDEDKELRIVLETCAEKQYTMKGWGSQVYIEYVVIPREFSLKTKDRVIVLNDLGGGHGTFEDAYW
jgi:hypothetical protein